MKRGSLGFVFALFLSLPVIAQDLSLKGSLIQGGLITGNTLPGAKIDLSGKKIGVNADGLFVFGFGRDAPAEAVINVLLPDGRRISRVLEIGQRKYLSLIHI